MLCSPKWDVFGCMNRAFEYKGRMKMLEFDQSIAGRLGGYYNLRHEIDGYELYFLLFYLLLGVDKHYFTEFSIGDARILWIGVHFVEDPSEPASCSEREGQAKVIA